MGVPSGQNSAGDAPLVAAKLGAASGEIRSGLIVVGDFAAGIGP
jgi:hypothetical protein